MGRCVLKTECHEPIRRKPLKETTCMPRQPDGRRKPMSQTGVSALKEEEVKEKIVSSDSFGVFHHVAVRLAGDGLHLRRPPVSRLRLNEAVARVESIESKSRNDDHD